MESDALIHPVYRSLNRPLTIWGVERRFFFLALAIGSAAFNFFGSLLAGLVMFAALYAFGRWATGTDPQILRIVLNSSTSRQRYDPLKATAVVRRRHGHD
jgi:type IV secretory pathway VirB3-like protein